MQARRKRINSMYMRVRKLTERRIEKAKKEKGMVELEDILIDKNRFFNRLMMEWGVREATLEDYFEVWENKGIFKELYTGFQVSFCLTDAYNNLPKSEQNKVD